MPADDEPTGPWLLALGTLALGVGAVAAEILRQRRTDAGDDDGRSSRPPDESSP